MYCGSNFAGNNEGYFCQISPYQSFNKIDTGFFILYISAYKRGKEETDIRPENPVKKGKQRVIPENGLCSFHRGSSTARFFFIKKECLSNE